MNPLLIIRTDILSTLFILFLIIYDAYYARLRAGENRFLGVAAACLGHDVTALVTELTINSDAVPQLVNDAAHKMFFFFAVLFSLKYFEYALALIMPKKEARIYRSVALALCFIASVVLFLSPVVYRQGNGTRYSGGIGAMVSYALDFALFVAAGVIMLICRKRIDRAVFYSLLPLSAMAVGFLAVHLFVPEFLFTGAALTLTSLGLFCATENPIGKLQREAFVDPDTRVWNRNCYEHDLENAIREKTENGAAVIYVLGDINGLKTINDRLGHQSGDKLIRESARVLTETMSHAFRINRIGGDEFAILYFDTKLPVVMREVVLASAKCTDFNFGENVPVGISFGVAEKLKEEEMGDTIRRADVEMYAAKDAYYREHRIDRRRNR